MIRNVLSLLRLYLPPSGAASVRPIFSNEIFPYYLLMGFFPLLSCFFASCLFKDQINIQEGRIVVIFYTLLYLLA